MSEPKRLTPTQQAQEWRNLAHQEHYRAEYNAELCETMRVDRDRALKALERRQTWADRWEDLRPDTGFVLVAVTVAATAIYAFTR